MNKKNILYFFYIFSFLLLSCDNSTTFPISIGKNSEVLVYTKDNIWQSEIGDSLISIFSQYQEGLNQREPTYELIQVNKLDNLLKKYRNILHIIINDSIKEPKVEYSKNLFAKPQTYVKITANNYEELIYVVNDTKNVLFEKFKNTDLNRIISAYKSQENIVLQNKIKKTFNISIVIPKSFYIAKTTDDFMWLRLETSKYSQGLMIYRQEFVDSSFLNKEYLINWKNKITQLYIPGEADGSYMHTDTVTNSIMNYVNWNNKKTIEIRGLWITIGDIMGGPHLTLFITDPKLKYVYAFDAYVFYPSSSKRDLLLQLEAIIHSVKFL